MRICKKLQEQKSISYHLPIFFLRKPLMKLHKFDSNWLRSSLELLA
jgi:hypothetical protein